jgi:hypothetical protein
MLIKGVNETLDPMDDAEQDRLIAALTDRVVEVTALIHAPVEPDVAKRVAAVAVGALDTELREGWAYLWLRTEICKTMADPDAWDGDGTEEGVLADYVRHLAMASHGECDGCGRAIKASERFDAIDNVGNSVPEGSPHTAVVLCGECA